MHSIPILESLSRGNDFESVSRKIGICSGNAKMRKLVSDIVISFSEKGDEYSNFIAAKQN